MWWVKSTCHSEIRTLSDLFPPIAGAHTSDARAPVLVPVPHASSGSSAQTLTMASNTGHSQQSVETRRHQHSHQLLLQQQMMMPGHPNLPVSSAFELLNTLNVQLGGFSGVFMNILFPGAAADDLSDDAATPAAAASPSPFSSPQQWPTHFWQQPQTSSCAASDLPVNTSVFKSFK